jgi:Holliday junction resolvase-like predicted endonuclease
MRVLARNLPVWPGEIDLLVDHGGSVVAVEVKTRVGADPVEEMTDLKAERLHRSGGRLPVRPARYDLVAVRLSAEGAEVRWIPAVC